jgi:transposase
MSLHPQPLGPVPEETARVARAAFPRGNLYMQMREDLGTIFTDVAFAPLFATRGRPAEAPWRLALVTIMQYAEGLSDRQAAQAVRSRIDWKYALGLELTDPGFDSTVLSEVRTRLLAGRAECLLLEALLEQGRERRWLRARGRQRTDSTHVLGAIRALNRVACVAETMRHVLNSLAVMAPEWLQAHSRPAWVARYGRRAEDDRWPKSEPQRQAYAHTVGLDGHALLDAIDAEDAPAWLRDVPAVKTLRRIWVQQYYRNHEGVRWRTATEGIPPSTRMISSPHDLDARYAKKYTTSWIGYKVHFTESCEADELHLITHVETTAGPIADGTVTPVIHEALQAKQLLPRLHIVDTGYLDAELLVTTPRDYKVELLGPTRPDYRWQARASQGFDASNFAIDWGQRQANCPMGQRSSSWTAVLDSRHNAVIKIKFSQRDCQACVSRPSCTRATRRTITVRPHEQHLSLQAARRREQTKAYQAEDAKRAGIEGTPSQAVRACGVRRARYIGMVKTHLQHVLTAAAINFIRIGSWLAGERPAQTRLSPFVALMKHAPSAA